MPSSSAVPRVMRPGGIGISPMMLCTVTDLPQPDSPTIASVLPARDAEARAAHGLDDAAVGVELDVQIVHRRARAVATAAAAAALTRGLACARRARRATRRRAELNASTVMLMKIAGNSSSCGCASIVLMPSLLMLPHDGVGGATPMPMNDRNASMKMTRGISNVSVTRITPIVFGIMCRNTR